MLTYPDVKTHDSSNSPTTPSPRIRHDQDLSPGHLQKALKSSWLPSLYSEAHTFAQP